MAGDIDMGHARALLPLDGATRSRLPTRLLRASYPVREDRKAGAADPEPAPKKDGPAPTAICCASRRNRRRDRLDGQDPLEQERCGDGHDPFRQLDQLDGRAGRLKGVTHPDAGRTALRPGRLITAFAEADSMRFSGAATAMAKEPCYKMKQQCICLCCSASKV